MNALFYAVKISTASKNKQNHVEQYSLFTFSQIINKKNIQNQQNSTVVLFFSNIYGLKEQLQ